MHKKDALPSGMSSDPIADRRHVLPAGKFDATNYK